MQHQPSNIKKQNTSSLPLLVYHLLIIGLTLLAAWLRFWQLDTIPPGLWFDEAYNAMDAVWMRTTDTWPVFLAGNNGREAMYHYLLLLSVSILGDRVYALRLVSALIGILSIPLMYRWTLTIFKGQSGAYGLALISAAGLTTSFWYLTMNRTAYRANLLPVFILGINYFFWRGWQTNKISFYGWAGVLLGLSQYTYLSARLLPLVFGLFVIIQTILLWKEKSAQLKRVWIGLAVMATAAMVVSLPLFQFFVNHPKTFLERVSDVAVKVEGTLPGLQQLLLHIWQAIRVFVDGQDPNWRHHLLGRPVLDFLNTIGFLIGLWLIVKNLRRPINTFLLLSLVVMWLPALLSEPVFHTLRLSGMLPAYYVFVAIGLFSLVKWVNQKISIPLDEGQVGLVALGLVVLISGSLTVCDYFFRWGLQAETYEAFDGKVVDLAHHLTDTPGEKNVIIPFYLYTHASMRYLLNDHFEEEVFLPPVAWVDFRRQDAVSLLIPEYPPDDGAPPAFVWLTGGEDNRGAAYVSAVNREAILTGINPKAGSPVLGSRGDIIAWQYSVTVADALQLFPQQAPAKESAVQWADNLRLIGYEFDPVSIESGENTTLFLNWEILGYTGLKQKMFLQILDSQANPVGQAELEPISRKMYRWRRDGLVLEQYPLKLDSPLNQGLYFVRLGFFDPDTGQRLMTYNTEEVPIGDEVIIGPFYVGQALEPQIPVRAMLDDSFEFLGYSIAPGETPDSTLVELYWQAQKPVDVDYTAFVQVLDSQNQIIAQVDAPPLKNIYPTSCWQSGDLITDRFILPIDMDRLVSNRLVTGMYDLSTGERLSVYNNNGELLPDGLISLID